MTPRTHLNIRLSQKGIKQADELAKEHGITRSQVLRAAIATGFRNPTLLHAELKRESDRP